MIFQQIFVEQERSKAESRARCAIFLVARKAIVCVCIGSVCVPFVRRHCVFCGVLVCVCM